MRILKRLGILAALTTALALSALAASASATVLCSTDATTCPAGSILPAGSYATAGMNAETLPTTFTIKTSNGFKFTCTYGSIGSQTSAEVGNPLPAESEGLLWGCGVKQFPKSSCQNISTQAPSTIEAAENGNGSLTIGDSSHRVSLDVQCTVEGSPLTCEYSTGSLPFAYDPSEGVLSTSEAALRKDGSGGTYASICGEGASLSTNMQMYEVGFSHGGTVVCSSWDTVCPTANILPSESVFSAGINSETLSETAFELKIGSTGLKVKCTYGGVWAETMAAVGSPLAADGRGEFWNCNLPAINNSSCQNLSDAAPAAIEAGENGDGTLTLGDSGHHFSLTVDCVAQGSAFTCEYSSASVPFVYEAGEGLLSTQKAALGLDGREGQWSELYCGSGAELSLDAQESEVVGFGTA